MPELPEDDEMSTGRWAGPWTRWSPAWQQNGLALSASATLFIGLIVTALQAGVALDASVDIAGFLGGDVQYQAHALAQWQAAHVADLALLALAIDLVLLVPAYGAFLFRFADAVTRQLQADGAPENLLAMWLPPEANPGRLRALLQRITNLRSLLRGATVALMASDVVEDALGLLAFGGYRWLDTLRWAHAAKSALLAVTLLLFAWLLFAWLFDIAQPDRRADERVRSRLLARALLRRDIADVVWRSRYSLAYIAFFVGVTLVMNQGQDLLVGMTHRGDRSAWSHLAVILATIASVWLFAYACYLWPRVMARTRRPANTTGAPPAESQVFAKWWPRLLGAAPMMILTLLSGHAARAAFAAGDARTGHLILLCGLVSALLAATFFGLRAVAGRRSQRIATGYFEVLDLDAALAEALRGPYAILMWIPRATISLVVLSFAGVALLRLWGLADDHAPLALAAIACALALWSSVLGQLSALALRQATPWILIGAVVSGLLGTLGLTDNHRVPVYSASGGDLSLTGMSWAALALGGVLLLYGAGIVHLAKRSGPSRRTGHALLLSAALALGGATLWVANAQDGGREREPAAARAEPLDQAIVDWLLKLCALEPGCGKGDAPVDAYLVSAEGGGIRAAYWTALVLSEMTLQGSEAGFAQRTFSISSVSGGSIGAAAYTVCLNQAADPAAARGIDAAGLRGCIDRFGRTDLLTPLVSSWLFEDVISRFVPTGACTRPGCGFMSRGLWFERSLESPLRARPGSQALSMTSALAGGEAATPRAGPHLFLNSTAVESGERAIASDVVIGPVVFPNARDQQFELGAALKLSTAAHNSARFPFVNAIGAVQRVRGQACPYAQKAAGGALDKLRPWLGLAPDCLHLADGGYFDNSGAQTTQDILRALRKALEAKHPELPGEEQARLTWLRSHLRLSALFVNYEERSDEELAKCQPQETSRRIAQSTAQGAAVPQERLRAEALRASGKREYDVTTPTCQGPLTLYSDLLGPAVTAKNVGGTGAGGRLAEARLLDEVADFHRALPPDAVAPKTEGIALQLERRAVLYPLGWYLSEQARTEMREQAARVAARFYGSGMGP